MYICKYIYTYIHNITLSMYIAITATLAYIHTYSLI